MMIENEVKQVIENSAFLALITAGSDGPHSIIAAKGEVSGEQVIFGIYKMEQTQKNLAWDNRAWVLGGTLTDGPKGYRLTGTAEARDGKVIFTASKVEKLI